MHHNRPGGGLVVDDDVLLGREEGSKQERESGERSKGWARDGRVRACAGWCGVRVFGIGTGLRIASGHTALT